MTTVLFIEDEERKTAQSDQERLIGSARPRCGVLKFGELSKIRIGTPGTHLATFVAGISNSHLTGAAVYVNSSGQLGVLASSQRYKSHIAPMADRSARLLMLRPVTFHLENEPHGELQYGLIAEEVAKVYPELVLRNNAGRIEGVRYDELAPMLLNELQKQQARIESLSRQLAEVADLKEELRTALRQLRSGDEIIARRTGGEPGDAAVPN